MQLVFQSLNLRKYVFSSDICYRHLHEIRELDLQAVVPLWHDALVLLVYLLQLH